MSSDSTRGAGRDPREVAREAVGRIRALEVASPGVAIVLGSGLSRFADGLSDVVEVPYSNLPGFPRPAVSGHGGTLRIGLLGGVRIVTFSGRVHYYEGRAFDEVTMNVRLAAELGARTLVLTNAAGGLDSGFQVGDLMLITDHICLLGGRAAFEGRGDRGHPIYAPRLRRLAAEVALERGIPLRSGVYLGSLGPTYETPAEIHMARRIGAHAAGMSTVSEASFGASRGLEVLGLSLITNLATPQSHAETTHGEVLAAGRLGAERLLSLVEGVLERL